MSHSGVVEILPEPRPYRRSSSVRQRSALWSAWEQAAEVSLVKRGASDWTAGGCAKLARSRRMSQLLRA